MSNDHSNKEQSQKIEQTPAQIDCGQAKPEDFKIIPADNERETPGHGQAGESLAEKRKLGADSPGFSPRRSSTPDRHITGHKTK
jgi:hypothetical protein